LVVVAAAFCFFLLWTFSLYFLLTLARLRHQDTGRFGSRLRGEKLLGWRGVSKADAAVWDDMRAPRVHFACDVVKRGGAHLAGNMRALRAGVWDGGAAASWRWA